jgi:hypothetical protein
LKVYEIGGRNQHASLNGGSHTIREFKGDYLRKKLGANLIPSNTRRIGDELRRIGQMMTEIPP